MPEQKSIVEFTDECEDELFESPVYGWSEIQRIANANGVYLITHGDDIVYIGESKNILNRFKKNHATGRNSAFRKNLKELDSLPDDFLSECDIRYLVLEYGRKEVEEELIKRYKPLCNK